jgi:dolichol-phosphate mannosyltransferase
MIYILLPAYNEVASIKALLFSIKEVMESGRYEYCVLVVDDGSNDGTLGQVTDCAAMMPIKLITHSINRGLWETIRDCFEWAAEHSKNGDVIIRMDADNTHDPKYIPSMLEKIGEGYDVVIASRFEEGGGAEGLTAYRTFISYCANLIMKLFFPIKGVKDYSCGFRAYRAETIQKAMNVFGNSFIDLKGIGFTCTIEKLIRFRMLKARFVEVPFTLRYDKKFSESKMLSHITTLGYLVLILKHVLPWRGNGKRNGNKIENHSRSEAQNPANEVLEQKDLTQTGLRV